jgi:hypothetical protein
MPAFTSLSPRELNQPCGSKELDAALADLRRVTARNWQIIPRRIEQRHWFRKTTERTFSLYVEAEGGEFQVINFYRDGTTWSINHCVPAELLMAYMLGAMSETQPANSVSGRTAERSTLVGKIIANRRLTKSRSSVVVRFAPAQAETALRFSHGDTVHVFKE